MYVPDAENFQLSNPRVGDLSIIGSDNDSDLDIGMGIDIGSDINKLCKPLCIQCLGAN